MKPLLLSLADAYSGRALAKPGTTSHTEMYLNWNNKPFLFICYTFTGCHFWQKYLMTLIREEGKDWLILKDERVKEAYVTERG